MTLIATKRDELGHLPPEDLTSLTDAESRGVI